MKWVLRILGVVALLVAALSVTAADKAKKTPKQLVVDTVSGFGTSEGGPGGRFYREFEVFEGGTSGSGEPIGEGVWYGVGTNWGWRELQTIRIFNRGVIHGDDTGNPWVGAIIGGTDDFAGASGEYFGECFGSAGAGNICRITFTFENPPRKSD